MSLIRDSLKKVQENADQKNIPISDSLGEPAVQPAPKKKVPVVILAALGAGVIVLAGFFFLLNPGEKQKIPAPVTGNTLAVTAPGPTVQPALQDRSVPQPQPVAPASDRPPSAGKGPFPGVELKEPVPAIQEKQLTASAEKEKALPSTARVPAKPIPPEMKKDSESKRLEKPPTAVERRKTDLREKEKTPPAAQQEAVRSHESTFMANYAKAFALQQAGQLSQAMALYRDILQEDPNNAFVLNNLGVIHQQQGDLRQAIVYYEKAHEVNPKFTQALNNLGVIYYRLGDYDQSLQWLEKSLQIQPDNGAVLQNLALIYKKKGNREEAKQILRKAIQNDPQLPELYYNLARLEEETGDYGQAVKNYHQFLKTRGMVNDKLSQDVIRQIEKLSSPQPASK